MEESLMQDGYGRETPSWHTYRKFLIPSTDTDYEDKLHLASLYGEMQEASNISARKLGIGPEELDEKGVCWLLSKSSMKILKYPKWGDQVTIETWSLGYQRLKFRRDYRFFLGTPSSDTMIGYATSEWFMAKKDKHRPVRPEIIMTTEKNLIQNQEEQVFPEDSSKIEPLVRSDAKAKTSAQNGFEEAYPILKKYVDYSDVDRNQHMNNTHYVSWAIDATFKFLQQQELGNKGEGFLIQRVDINFINELFLSEKVYLWIIKEKQPQNDLDWFVVEGVAERDQRVAFRVRLGIKK